MRNPELAALHGTAKVLEMECEVNVLRSFIDIPVPNSDQRSSQNKTASTTDAAGGRKGPNDRK